jgi:predicted PurR-regulated permease PerM
MKFIISLLLTALLSFAAGLYLPWWSIALCAFIVSLLILQPPLKAFLAGFAGVFLLWVIFSWFVDAANDHILSHKIAQIFPLGGISFLLILVTALVGGLVGGFAALSGSYLRYGARRK